jgi:hypothetical protein
VQSADQTDDLLVVGTGRQGRLARLFHGSVSRYCLAHAGGAVLAVAPCATRTSADRAEGVTASRRATTLSAAA